MDLLWHRFDPEGAHTHLKPDAWGNAVGGRCCGLHIISMSYWFGLAEDVQPGFDVTQRPGEHLQKITPCPNATGTLTLDYCLQRTRT